MYLCYEKKQSISYLTKMALNIREWLGTSVIAE